jgi:hypothetical protein
MRVSNFPAMASAPTPPPREQMLAAREGANPLVSFASLGGGGAPQPAPAQAPMAFAQGGNSGGMQPQPVQMKMGADGLPTAMQGIQASFGGGIPFAPEGDAGSNDSFSAMMAALSQPKPLRETLGLVDELIGGSADSNELDPMEVASSDEDGGGLLGGLFGTRTDAATIQEPEIDARPIFDSGGMSQDEYDRVRGRTEARMRREQPDMVNNFVDDDGVEAAELAMTGGMGEADEGDPVGLLDLPRGNNGLFGKDPLGNTTIDAIASGTRGATPNVDALLTTPEVRPSDNPMLQYQRPPALDAPQEVATMPQPFEAPMPQPAMQPQQPQPQFVEEERSGWINPAGVGTDQTIGQTFGRLFGGLGGFGGTPATAAADVPVQGAMSAQGMPQGDPRSLAVGESMPTPQAAPAQGVPQGAQQPQQAAQAPAQAPAPSGEPSPMRQAFADMLGAIGQSLMETGDLRGVGKAMQGLRLASMERSKSRAEQNAIVAALRTAMPNATDEFLYTLAGDPSGRAGKIAMDAAQAAQQQALAAQEREQSERTAAEFASEAERFAGPLSDGTQNVPMPEYQPAQQAPMPTRSPEPDTPSGDAPATPMRAATPQAEQRIGQLEQEITRYEQARMQQLARVPTREGEDKAIDRNLKILDEQISRRRSEIAQLTAPTPDFSNIQQLTTRFETETEPHSEVFRRYNQFQRLMTQKSAPSDNLLIQTVQRMFDPRMRRPGAQAGDETIGSSYLDRAANTISLFMDGNVLTPKARAELLAIADEYASEYALDFEDLAEATRSRSRELFPTRDPDRTVLAQRNAQYNRFQKMRESRVSDEEQITPMAESAGITAEDWAEMTAEERGAFQ